METCVHENNPYFDPAATVTAVVLRPDQPSPHVLLTRRAIEPFKDHWCLPGGHVDRYESSYNAIVREVREETGLTFTGQSFGSFDEIFPDRRIHHVVTAFAGIGTGTLEAQEDEVSDMKWFPLEEALTMALAFVHQDILKAYAQSLKS